MVLLVAVMCGTSAGEVLRWRSLAAGLAALIRGWSALGLPPAVQILLEGAVFGMVTVLAARFDEVSLAAHRIAVQRDLHHLHGAAGDQLGCGGARGAGGGAQGSPRGVAAAGWAAMLLGGGLHGRGGSALWVAPQAIIGRFMADRAVIAAGVVPAADRGFLRALRRVCRWCDGRAAGTRRNADAPMIAHLVGLLGGRDAGGVCAVFPAGLGRHAGIWIGLERALILIGAALAIVMEGIRSSTARW